MAREFRLPDPGEGIHEAEIIEVKVADGDEVAEGDELFIVETDKAEVEVPAPFTGTVEKVMVSNGDDVRVGDVLLTYSESSGSGSGSSEEREDAGRDEPEDGDDDAGEDRGKSPERSRKQEADDKREEREEEAEEEADEEKREHEEEEQEEPEAVEDEDDEQDEEKKDEEEEEEETKKKKKERAESEDEPRARRASDDESERSADQEAAGGKTPPGPVPAAPSTRRLARELGVDLEKLSGRGDEGRVTDDDVREAAGEETGGDGERAPDGGAGAGEGLPPSKWPLTPRRPELPDFERWGEVERIELRGVRRSTAQRMALAWSQIPHVTHEDVADITELEQFRRGQSEAMESRGASLTLTTLVVKAVVAALKEFPRFNASLDPEAGEIVLKHYYHVGVAVATDRGLLVPVIRDADRKTVAELAVELAELADRARDGDLDLEEMRGGTFSITNPGGIGGTRFTPIINFPQVAILGCGRARLEPVASGEIGSAQVSHRFRLPLCLGFDHRVNDGADAARFVNFIRELLGDPESFTLGV